MKNLELDGEWKLTWTAPGEKLDFQKANWIEASVPGEVHLDLYRAGKIPDPYFGINFMKCQWMEKTDFWYRKEFSLPADFIDNKMILRFEGLDTFATIWVNDKCVDHTRNMFIHHELDISGLLNGDRNNTITVRLSGPISFVEKGENFPHLPIDVSSHPAIFNMPWRLFSRKMQMSYGWDNVPRMVTTGIFRSVSLLCYEKVRIGDVHLTNEIKDNNALLLASATIDGSDGGQVLSLQMSVVDQDGKKVAQRELSRVQAGEKQKLQEFEAGVDLENARLWWPYQLGEPHLYKVTFTLYNGEQILDCRELRYGIRSVRIVTEPTEIRKVDYRIGNYDDPTLAMDGGFIKAWSKFPLESPEEVEVRPFRLEVNGQPLFMKGVNWQPADNFLPNVTNEKYEVLLRRVREANLNLVRIWGGGVPEDDFFYDLCDQLGIVVWQDFLFACGLYPQEDWFVKEVEHEVEEVIKRLRNRTCIAVWCGDNEGDMMNDDMGKDPAVSGRITHHLIPSLLKKLDSSRYYHISSPSGGGYPRSPWGGDKRNWGAFYPQDFYAHIRGDEGQFISEGGSYSLPSLRTIRTFIPESEMWPVEDSEAWYYHLGNVPGTHRQFELLMQQYIKQYFGDPQNIEQYIWLSQYAQAQGYKAFVEHFRRRKYDCGGFAIWKYSDTWPCGCMSMVDYELDNKISYYYTQRASSPLLVSLKYAEDRFEAWVINDYLQPKNGTISIDMVNLHSGEFTQLSIEEAIIEKDASVHITDIALKDIETYDKHNHVLVGRFQANGVTFSQNIHYLDDIVKYQLPEPIADVSFKQMKTNEITVMIMAKTFIKDVGILLPDVNPGLITYSDNHFPLLPGESMKVSIKGPENIQKPQIILR